MPSVPINIIIYVTIAALIVLRLISFGVQKAIDALQSGDQLQIVIWFLLVGTPVISLLTLLFESVYIFYYNVTGPNSATVGLNKLIILSVASIATLAYLGYSVYNVISSSNAGQVNNAINWAFIAAIPIIVVITTWILGLL